MKKVGPRGSDEWKQSRTDVLMLGANRPEREKVEAEEDDNRWTWPSAIYATIISIGVIAAVCWWVYFLGGIGRYLEMLD